MRSRRGLHPALPVGLVLIACLVGGCGSGSGSQAAPPGHTAGNAGSSGASATTAAAQRASSQAAAETGDSLAALTGGSPHPTMAERSLARLVARNTLLPGSHLRSPTRAEVAAAAIASSSAAINKRAIRPTKTCPLTIQGRTVPVACDLRKPLLSAVRHDKPLARLLAKLTRRRR